MRASFFDLLALARRTVAAGATEVAAEVLVIALQDPESERDIERASRLARAAERVQADDLDGAEMELEHLELDGVEKDERQETLDDFELDRPMLEVLQDDEHISMDTGVGVGIGEVPLASVAAELRAVAAKMPPDDANVAVILEAAKMLEGSHEE